MSNENSDLKADVAGTDTQADAREGGCDTGTEGADLNWLKERIAQPGTCPPRWQHVLDLTDVVEVLRGSDIESAALERHLAAEQSKMDKAMRGNAAKDPREVGMRGGAVGGVKWLIDQGWAFEDARTFIAETMGIERETVVGWCQQAARQEMPTTNYKLSIPFAAERMRTNLDDVLRSKHNILGPDAIRLIIKEMFSPVSP